MRRKQRLHHRDRRLRGARGARRTDHAGDLFEPIGGGDGGGDGDEQRRDPIAGHLGRGTPAGGHHHRDAQLVHQFAASRQQGVHSTGERGQQDIVDAGTAGVRDAAQGSEVRAGRREAPARPGRREQRARRGPRGQHSPRSGHRPPRLPPDGA
jgi:hypothetical protein